MYRKEKYLMSLRLLHYTPFSSLFYPTGGDKTSKDTVKTPSSEPKYIFDVVSPSQAADANDLYESEGPRKMKEETIPVGTVSYTHLTLPTTPYV